MRSAARRGYIGKRKKATLGGEDRLCTGAKGRNTEGVERPSGETTIPGAPARLAESRLRGDGGEGGNASRVSRVQTPLSGAVWQTSRGERGRPAAQGRASGRHAPSKASRMP